MSTKPPNPGSDEALDRGCTCAVLDNNHGRGVPWPRDDGLDPEEHPSFWISENCPLHGRAMGLCTWREPRRHPWDW